MYCVDPSTGYARMIFTRPRDPGRAQVTDERLVYGALQVPVREDLNPLAERLDVDLVVDSDLIVTVHAHSELTGTLLSREIHELEFGLDVGGQGP